MMQVRLSVLIACTNILYASAFSMQMSVVGDASVTKARLAQAMSSPSGKMTISPEIAVPEPSDPTKILLQQSELPKLSDKLRTQVKANAVFVSGTVQSLSQFAIEQETARGNFPGPIPVVYCNTKDAGFSEIADAGACGVVVSVNNGEEVGSAGDILVDSLSALAASALGVGLQPIPEVTLDTSVIWGEDEVTDLVNKLKEACGASPAAVILTHGVNAEAEDGDDASSNEEVALPIIPKQLQKEIPIIGSVREKAGEGRMGGYIKRLKECGYTGCLLRSECVPGFQMNPDLEFVGKFWTAAITDLKSVRSKTFGGFRAKNQMNKGTGFLENWATYQNALVDGQVLPSQAVENDLNSDGGDYRGF